MENKALLRIFIVTILCCMFFFYIIMNSIDKSIHQKPSSFNEVDYSIKKIPTTKKNIPSTEVEGLSLDNDNHIKPSQSQPEIKNNLLKENKSDQDLKVLCLSTISSCETCYDEDNLTFKSCSSILNKIELEFASNLYDSSLPEKINQKLIEYYSNDYMLSLSDDERWFKASSWGFDRLKEGLTEDQQNSYYIERGEYLKRNPVKCFVSKRYCENPLSSDDLMYEDMKNHQ